MKTSKITLSLTAMAIAAAVTVYSCKKKETISTSTTTVKDTDTNSASDNNLAERSADDIVNICGNIAENPTASSFRSVCASITRDTAAKTITVTFNGSPCDDGRVRSGSLVFDFSKSAGKFYRIPGFSVTVTSSNYVVDGNAVTIINKTITNTTTPGFNPSSTNLTWAIVSNISIAKANNGGTVTWTASKTKTLLNTSDTNVYHGALKAITWSKAIIGITGNASGTTAAGDKYTANVTNQLVRDCNCAPISAYTGYHPFISGTMDFTPGTKATRHIDYGYPNNGGCDDSVSVTVNGKMFLRARF